jgi:capsular exopolysaccharide synthesis family protein
MRCGASRQPRTSGLRGTRICGLAAPDGADGATQVNTPENMDGSLDQGPAGVAMSERLAYYLKVLRRRWHIIVLVPGVAVVVSLIVGLGAQKKYDATAKLVVNPNNQVTAVLNPSASQSSPDPERDLNTEVSRIKTVPIADAVRRRLRLAESRNALLAKVTTSLEGTTNIVKVKVRDPSPGRAAQIANAFAAGYVSARESDARSAFREAAAQARRQLESLSAADQASPQGLQLQARLRELEVDSALQTGNAQVLQEATVPTSAASPKVLLGAALAAFLGLILGGVAAGVIELLDRRVKDEDDVKLATRAPTLAAIPHARGPVRSRLLPLDWEQTEAYRSLATNLRFFKLGGEIKTLMITSPGPLDGKTNVTLSLSAALAEFGQKVIAVESDLRRPRFADYLQLPQAPGLSSVLAGMASWSQQVVHVDVSRLRVDNSTIRGESPHFSVLAGGQSPPNPQALLSSAEMGELMLDLRSSRDVVLIDTPPLGTLTDAVPLVSRVDGVVLVVHLQHTTREGLKKACEVLAELDGTVLGTVLIGGARPALSGYYGTESASSSAAGRQRESRNGRAAGRVSEGTPTSRT